MGRKIRAITYTPPANAVIRPATKKWFVWSVLLVILLLSGYLRYRLVDVPLERDEGEYAYAGQLILKGVPPYSEVYNMKLPGIYGAYALLLAVFGQTHQGIHTGLLIVNSATIAFVFLLAKRLLNPLAAIISAAAFALLSVSQSVQGIFANAEHFVIVFSTAGLLVMLKALAEKSHLKLFAAGILLCLGSLMKQHGIMFCVLAILYIILDGLLCKPVLWKSLLLKLLSLSAGLVTVLGCLLLTMVWCGVFKQFWFWTVEYALAYVSQVPLVHAGKIFVGNFSEIFASAPLLWILAGLGIIAISISKKVRRPHKVFLLLFALFSFLSICPGFFFRPHYFVLLLPSIALLCGGMVYVLSHWLSFLLPNRFSYSLPVIIILAGIGQSVYLQADYLFHMTPFEISRSTYWVNPFSESLQIADFIRNHTTPEDTIAILGSEPQICFYAQRRSASGHIYMYPLMEQHEYALQMQKDFIWETEAKKPKYVVLANISTSWLRNRNSPETLFEWIDPYLQTKYKLVGTIELFDSKTAYHWHPQIKWSPSSRYSVQVFERQN